jgi:hypothetical protein
MLLKLVVGALIMLFGVAMLMGSRVAPPTDDDIIPSSSIGSQSAPVRLELMGMFFTLIGAGMVTAAAYRLFTRQ